MKGVEPCYQIAAVVDGLLCGLVGKSVAGWRRIASGFGAMRSTGRALVWLGVI